MVQAAYFIEQATVEIRVSFTEALRSFSDLTTSATGFYVRHQGVTHLVTNWHVVTGHHFQTDKNLVGDETPRYLVIREWVTNHEYVVPLYNPDGRPTWNELPKNIAFEGKPARIDVATIPSPTLIQPIEVYSHLLPQYQRLEPHDSVVIVGFPTARANPIWKTAHVAESIHHDRPYFLVNGRTKKGMSGSGVFSTGQRTLQGNIVQGIYSGRIDDRDFMETLNDLDLGIVWKPWCLAQLLPQKVT